MPLFERDIRWGVTKGSHVARILLDNEEPVQENSNSLTVSQAEIYDNAGDQVTQERFTKMAEMIKKNYDLEKCKETRPFMDAVFAYITADGRQKQQDAYKKMHKEFLANYSRYRDEPHSENNLLVKFAEQYLIMPSLGGLDTFNTGIPSVSQKDKNGEIKEPNSGAFLGRWVDQSEEALFPHTPSPNDIKQGLGAQNCFMMAPLIQLAAKNPKAITEAMRDNLDGTVSVRFFKKEKQEDGSLKKEPVIITVNKTVNKRLGRANTYASASLWVQMMEKAYVVYQNTIGAEAATDDAVKKQLQNGYSAIDRGSTDEFMNAFSQTDYTKGMFASAVDDKSYAIDAKGKLMNARPGEGYLKQEVGLYDFLKKHIDKEVMTVGLSSQNKTRQNYALDHGVRVGHAYAITKVFEKEMNGQMKKFVQLRDPYAVFSGTYNEKGQLVNNSSPVSGTLSAGTDNMGTFNLELVDFHKIMSHFTGISVEAAGELKQHLKQWEKDGTQLYQPDKVEEKENVAEPQPEGKAESKEAEVDGFEILGDEKPQAESKEAEVDGFEILGDEKPQAEAKVKPERDMLTHPDLRYNAMNKWQAKDIAENLKAFECLAGYIFATDQFYVGTNSSDFREMKADIKNAIIAMKRVGKGETFSKDRLGDFVTACEKLKESTQKYVDYKTDRNQKEGFDAGSRARRRLDVAQRILDFCDNGYAHLDLHDKENIFSGWSPEELAKAQAALDQRKAEERAAREAEGIEIDTVQPTIRKVEKHILGQRTNEAEKDGWEVMGPGV